VHGNNLVGRVQRQREADARQIVCHLQDARDHADRGHGHRRATHAEEACVRHHVDRRPHFVVIIQGLLSKLVNICSTSKLRKQDHLCQQSVNREVQALCSHKQVGAPNTRQIKAAHPHAHEDDIPNGRKGPRMHQLLDDLP
jgi:hypothetical protein